MESNNSTSREVYDLLQLVDRLQRTVDNIKTKAKMVDWAVSGSSEQRTKNTVLGYDNSFCLEDELMFVVDSCELVTIGKQCKKEKVKTYSAYTGDYAGKTRANTLTHNIEHCVKKLCGDLALSSDKYIQMYKLDSSANEDARNVVLTHTAQRVNNLIKSATWCALTGDNRYNTKKYYDYKNLDLDTLKCPACGGYVHFEHYRSDDYYFKCTECERTHWFTYFPEFGIDLPVEMRSWEEDIAINKINTEYHQ